MQRSIKEGSITFLRKSSNGGEGKSKNTLRTQQQQGNRMIRKDQINNIILVLFNCAVRVYYLPGGRCKWFNAWLLTEGFPMLLIPIAFSHMLSRVRGPNQS
ncbi:hypothetical protein CRG98_049593 [Punica granatum]|nr:hypothetical protein CRG98_049593 [Punica granatum]